MVTEAASDRPAESTLRGVLGDLIIFALAVAGTYVAQGFDRPITAVLIFLTGVIFIGAHSGVNRGVIAALAAALFYNFFLSEPAFRFGVTSLDEVVPLIAFNICAIVTGALAGRLTDRARAAQAAESHNALLLKISESFQTVIVINDIEDVARSCLEPHGIDDIEIYFRKDGRLYRCGDDDAPVLAFEAFLSTDQAIGDRARSAIYELNGTSGEVGLVKFRQGSIRRDDGRPADMQPVANILALAIDRCLLLEQLSESKALKRSEELKSAILSSVSHDLRTPLTVIEATAGSLRACDDSITLDQRNKLLKTIIDQCHRLNRYTANLLDIGRIQAGISASSFQDIDALEILGVALANMRQSFPEQVVEKKATVSEAIVRANGPMMEQAIFNLLENAVVHGASSEALKICVDIRNDECAIEITDSGSGISQSDQTLIFDPFYRSAQKPVGRGTGLGLYIAKGFIEAFGGSLSVLSPVNGQGGTTMAIRLPLSATLAKLETAA